MARQVLAVWRNEDGAIAPTIGISLFGLVAVAGVAFDYSRMASLDTELQNAADQAALAAATQLDGRAYACSRARAAARRLIENKTYLSNDGNPTRLLIDDTVDGSGAINTSLTYTADDCSDPDDFADDNIVFYESYDNASDTYGDVAETDATANVVEVTIGGRRVNFALTPIVAAITSGDLSGTALASMTSAICKTPPVMLCNPNEPSGNTNIFLDPGINPGDGLRLVTGDATLPGNFGWLEAGLGNSATALAAELGYNQPTGVCQATGGVDTKTGMTTSVIAAFNTRFDVWDPGLTCPAKYGGTCSPGMNTTKDLICEEKVTGGVRSCKGASWVWQGRTNANPKPADPYDPFIDASGNKYVSGSTAGFTQRMLPTNGSIDPKVMGYPHDLCHSSLRSRHNCGGNGIKGNGVWDRDAYFRINYGWPKTVVDTSDPDNPVVTTQGWEYKSGLPSNATRYQVYQWEIANTFFDNNGAAAGGEVGISVPKKWGTYGAKDYYAFGQAANGTPGVAQDVATGQADRRTIGVAVLNCQALTAYEGFKSTGNIEDAPVAAWIQVFLVEPAWPRDITGKGIYTEQKDIYVEYVKKIEVSADQFAEVVRRDKPYLLR